MYKTIDLCAGIGGIRRGFELTGYFKNVLAAEIDKYAAATYKHLYGEDPTNDLTSEEFKKKVVNTEYDVLLAGFPCQAFSRAGKQLGFHDAMRGTVFFDIADIILRTTPKAIFLENVENLISHDKGSTISTIVKTLEDELGYSLIGVDMDEEGKYCYSNQSLIRNTKYFGLPQNRPRTYIMGFSKRKYGVAIKHFTGNLPTKGNKIIFRDVNEVLEKNVEDKYYMAEGYLKTLKKHKERQIKNGNGFGYCVVNSKDKKHPIANTILATGGSGKERNLIYQPKEGVAGKKISGKRTPLNDEGIRVMTPIEWGRLQGFIGYAFIDDNGIDRFDFPQGTTDGQKYKQFGNSVSIPVIEVMANFMVDCFNKINSLQTEIVIDLVKKNKIITKKDVIQNLDITKDQAEKILKKMVDLKQLTLVKNKKYSEYKL